MLIFEHGAESFSRLKVEKMCTRDESPSNIFFVDSPNSVTLLTLMNLAVSHRYYVE